MTDRPPRHFGAQDVRAAVPMADAIVAVGAALAAAARDGYDQPRRLALDDGRLLVMAATMRATGDAVVKAVSIAAAAGPRAAVGGTAVQGTVLWLDGKTGRATLTADGGAVTALRTGAATGVATSLLAAPLASRLAMLGSGGQAMDQIRAVCQVRQIDTISIFSRTPANARALGVRVGQELPAVGVRVGDSARSAVRDADVVCCATTATAPLFRSGWLADRVHVNAIGSYRAHMCELPADLLATASIVAVDDVPGCLHEAGEVVAAVAAGALPAARLRPLGALVEQRPPGTGRTVYKSVGCAVLDWAIASVLASRPGPASE
jgi:ornithine cyclodeaminase